VPRVCRALLLVCLAALFAAVAAPGAAYARSPGRASAARHTAQPASTYAHVFSVNDPGDTPDANPNDLTCADAGGKCTLRAAIQEANRQAGNDLIEFSQLPGQAPVTINVRSRLPDVGAPNSGSLTIDGYTQPTSRVNSTTVGSNAIPGVELVGSGTADGNESLYIKSASNVIRGLVINNFYRGPFMDTTAAHDNYIVGNWIGFTRTGENAADKMHHGVLINTGATNNHVGTADLADRNVIGNAAKAIDLYGPGTDGNVIQDNQLCIGPSGFTAATCNTGIDHDFGPKNGLIGGTGVNERNIIGPTQLQGIEYSHGWNPATQNTAHDYSDTWTIRGNQAIGNWVGFRGDGSYDASFRSGQVLSSSDNGEGINVYDGSSGNLIEGNWIAAKYDGINTMAPTAHGNVFRGNIIGTSPTGQAAPLTGWGIKVRWATTDAIIEANVIRNAALGGIGLVAVDNTGKPQAVAYHIRITRNLVTLTAGPVIFLGQSPSGQTPAGGNNLVAAPVVTKATTAVVRGTGIPGATMEVYQATRKNGAGVTKKYLGSTIVKANGNWKFAVSGITAGQYVSALQIRPDNDTSPVAKNLKVVAAPTT
jgi:CSLREA domain-containing protein